MKYLLNEEVLGMVAKSAEQIMEGGRTTFETRVYVSPETYAGLVASLPEEVDELKVEISLEILPDRDMSGPGGILESD